MLNTNHRRVNQFAQVPTVSREGGQGGSTKTLKSSNSLFLSLFCKLNPKIQRKSSLFTGINGMFNMANTSQIIQDSKCTNKALEKGSGTYILFEELILYLGFCRILSEVVGKRGGQQAWSKILDFSELKLVSKSHTLDEKTEFTL